MGCYLVYHKNVRNPSHHYFSKSIAIHLQFVLQYASNLYCSAFGAIELSGKGSTSVLFPYVSQYASHLYRNTPLICMAICLPFVSQYCWEDLGGCGHQDGPQFMQLQFGSFSELILHKIGEMVNLRMPKRSSRGGGGEPYEEATPRKRVLDAPSSVRSRTPRQRQLSEGLQEWFANPSALCRGQNPQNQEKRVSVSKKTISRHSREGRFESKIHHVSTGQHTAFDSKRPGVFRPHQTSFSVFVDFDPCAGWTDSQSTVSKDAILLRGLPLAVLV